MRKLTEPRFIRPENIEIGDTIRVAYPVNGGIRIIKEGTVAERQDHNACRILLTAEGGHLLAWEPGGQRDIRITLLDRKPVNNDPTLFDLPMTADLGEVRARI